MSIPNVLTIAGTDPSGGAGIMADLKAFGALRTHGCAVVTAVVAQNTRGVAAVTQMTPQQVRTQLAREPYPYPTLRLTRRPETSFDYAFEDFAVEGYQHHPGIKAPVAV